MEEYYLPSELKTDVWKLAFLWSIFIFFVFFREFFYSGIYQF